MNKTADFLLAKNDSLRDDSAMRCDAIGFCWSFADIAGVHTSTKLCATDGSSFLVVPTFDYSF